MAKKKHLVLFPLLSQGHIFPFLALAKQLECTHSDHCNITIVSTPLNIVSIRQSLPQNSAIGLAEIPFPGPEHGLPPGLENSDKLPFHLFENFFRAVDSLQPSFERLLSETVRRDRDSAVCILADMYLGWTVQTAEKLRVFHSVFVTNGAYATAVLSSLLLHPPRSDHTKSSEVALENYPHVKIPISLTKDYTGEEVQPVIGFFRRQVSLSFQSRGLLVNTAAELEEVGMSLLRASPALPAWAVGPLLWRQPPKAVDGGGCIEWLGCHPPASVVYVSFGSQNSISSSEMMDLAVGLEAGGRPFVWAVRPPVGFDMAEEGFRAEWLPEGFELRMREERRGLLVHGWAPQLEILSHPSTGAFLSHCGWNSVLESLSAGVPIVGWPLLVDQLFNSRMLEELGVGVEVARGEMAEVGAEGGCRRVAEAVELVMGAAEMRRKAGEIGEGMKAAMERDGGSSTKALLHFFDYFSDHSL